MFPLVLLLKKGKNNVYYHSDIDNTGCSALGVAREVSYG